MIASDFRSLSASAFAVVVAKRRALAAARAAVAEALDADPCDRSCTCERAPAIRALVAAESAAYHEAREAEAAWVDYCDVRREAMA